MNREKFAKATAELTALRATLAAKTEALKQCKQQSLNASNALEEETIALQEALHHQEVCCWR
jgi:hypothetical protein